MDVRISAEGEGRAEGPTGRQREVLDAALSLLVDPRRQLTMTAVAAAASCSKETLYKWFGGREGLLTATVQWQAAKVRAVPVPEQGVDRTALEASLTRFAEDWLEVLSGETSVALNRLAVGEAGMEGHPLGRIVLENGPFAMRRRLEPILLAARTAGLLVFAEVEEAFRTFFGLVVRDMQIRLLLGDASAKAAPGEAARAVSQFLALYGARS